MVFIMILMKIRSRLGSDVISGNVQTLRLAKRVKMNHALCGRIFLGFGMGGIGNFTRIRLRFMHKDVILQTLLR